MVYGAGWTTEDQGFVYVIKILSVSDVAEASLLPALKDKRFDDISLILSCGDLPPEYLASLVDTLKAPLFYVLGNHDIRYAARQPHGCLNLHRRLVTFGRLNFLGLEGSMWYNGGPYQYTENEMRRLIRRLRTTIWWRGGVDVMITHAPPRGIHDEEDLCHQGFESFRWLINKYKPQYFIHGHIHKNFAAAAERISQVDATTVINTYGHHIFAIDDAAHHR